MLHDANNDTRLCNCKLLRLGGCHSPQNYLPSHGRAARLARFPAAGRDAFSSSMSQCSKPRFARLCCGRSSAGGPRAAAQPRRRSPPTLLGEPAPLARTNSPPCSLSWQLRGLVLWLLPQRRDPGDISGLPCTPRSGWALPAVALWLVCRYGGAVASLLVALACMLCPLLQCQCIEPMLQRSRSYLRGGGRRDGFNQQLHVASATRILPLEHKKLPRSHGSRQPAASCSDICLAVDPVNLPPRPAAADAAASLPDWLFFLLLSPRRDPPSGNPG